MDSVFLPELWSQIPAPALLSSARSVLGMKKALLTTCPAGVRSKACLVCFETVWSPVLLQFVQELAKLQPRRGFSGTGSGGAAGVPQATLRCNRCTTASFRAVAFANSASARPMRGRARRASR